MMTNYKRYTINKNYHLINNKNKGANFNFTIPMTAQSSKQ